MALFQTQTPPPIYSHGFSFKTHSYSPVALPYHLPPPSLPLSVSSMKTHHQSSLVSPSTVKRKLLCSPPHGKHVREDYLVKKVSAQEVQELVKGDRDVPIIVDFFATWCGPCILMAQELEMVRGLPTLLFISPDSSKDAIRTEGLIPLQMMRDIIDNEL
ncbi:thioredoxin-like protein CITRX, chloroplastic isoform X2 [Pyrus x bretschneideri]|uniref:thioredoxin-like protein CITRX, chloroplastic isoform X2 n=1 Tax=Pyrus x bretschneideri TaxID=225117 RepID=UPI002030931F|nr:thioredoxin-like protein CITRX, chloroplastic isoform X2 [Pyrus x bretschneideri]